MSEGYEVPLSYRGDRLPRQRENGDQVTTIGSFVFTVYVTVVVVVVVDSHIQRIVLVVVVVVFTLKTVLTSIQYPSLSYSSRQRNEFPWSHANPK